MTDSMEPKNVFYSIVIPFLMFFSAFALVIYPNRAVLHPHGFVDLLAARLPANFAAPLAIVRNWSFAVFYVAAEMWGSAVASLLFWGFANEVTTVEEAKKYYPLFGLFANVALIFSGQYVKFVSNMRASLAPGVDAWAVSLKYLMGGVLGSGGVLLAAYKYMQDQIVAKDAEHELHEKAPSQKEGQNDNEGVGQILDEQHVHSGSGYSGDFLRNVHQHCRSELEGPAQGGLSGPQFVLIVHGQLLVGDGCGHAHHDAAGSHHLSKIWLESRGACHTDCK